MTTFVAGHQDYARSAGYTLDRPDAPNLALLLHGLGGDRHQPLRLTIGLEDALDRDDVTILAPDARAHGETGVIGTDTDFAFEAMVDDLLALLDHLGQTGKPLYVAGISMGAALALRLALRHPAELTGLALIRPAFTDRPYPPNLEPLRLVASLLRSGEDGRARFANSPLYREVASISPSGAASLIDQFDKPQARERAIRLAAIPSNPAWRHRTDPSGITVPTIVLGADRDPVHPLGIAQQWTRSLDHAGPAGALLHILPARDADPEAHERTTRALMHNHLAAQLSQRTT